MIPGASNVYNTANIDFPVKVSHPFVPDLNCLYMAQGKSPLETSNNTRTWKKKNKFTFRGKEQRNQCHYLNLQAIKLQGDSEKKNNKNTTLQISSVSNFLSRLQKELKIQHCWLQKGAS